MKAYHYTSKPFESFNAEKCDGIWVTTIQPEDTEMLEEIGAAGLEYCAVCEIDFDETLVDGSNYDVAEQLEGTEFDCIENRYDGFNDYAFSDASKVKIIEWVKM